MLLLFGTLIYLSVGEEWHLPVIRLIMFLIELDSPLTFSAIYARELASSAGSFTFTDHCGVLAVRFFSYLFKHIHQPGVIGEIVAGIVLGPFFIGLFLFPKRINFFFQ